jgi:hypothetical protein
MCDIPLESSRQELQLCFKPQLKSRFTRKVIGFQSCESPCWRNFGTQESRERKAIWMYALWLATKYSIRGRWWLPPSPGRGEYWVFVLPVVRPSTKGVPTMHEPPCVGCVQAYVSEQSLSTLPSPIPELQHAPLPLKMLWVKERAPTPPSSVIFFFDSHLSPSRSWECVKDILEVLQQSP